MTDEYKRLRTRKHRFVADTQRDVNAVLDLLTEAVKALRARDDIWETHATAIQREMRDGKHFENPMVALASRVVLDPRYFEARAVLDKVKEQGIG